MQCHHSCWPNKLYDVSPPKENLSGFLKKLERDISVKELPRILLFEDEDVQPELIEAAKNRGYTMKTWARMSYSLNNFSQRQAPAEFSHALITNEQELETWTEIVERELMAGGTLDRDMLMGLMNNENCYFFLGFIDDIPAATSMLYCSDNESGIYLVATDSTHRNKGLGSMMTAICLEKSNELGIERASLQATDLGFNVYKKLGFQDEGPVHVMRINSLQEA